MREYPQCNHVVEVVRKVKYEGGTTYIENIGSTTYIETKCPDYLYLRLPVIHLLVKE